MSSNLSVDDRDPVSFGSMSRPRSSRGSANVLRTSRTFSCGFRAGRRAWSNRRTGRQTRRTSDRIGAAASAWPRLAHRGRVGLTDGQRRRAFAAGRRGDRRLGCRVDLVDEQAARRAERPHRRHGAATRRRAATTRRPGSPPRSGSSTLCTTMVGELLGRQFPHHEAVRGTLGSTLPSSVACRRCWSLFVCWQVGGRRAGPPVSSQWRRCAWSSLLRARPSSPQ